MRFLYWLIQRVLGCYIHLPSARAILGEHRPRGLDNTDRVHPGLYKNDREPIFSQYSLKRFIAELKMFRKNTAIRDLKNNTNFKHAILTRHILTSSPITNVKQNIKEREVEEKENYIWMQIHSETQDILQPENLRVVLRILLIRCCTAIWLVDFINWPSELH